MKILWFDVETTGLDAKKNDIITFAGIIEIDGKIVDEIYLKMQPHNWETIDNSALEVNGITREELKTFQSPDEAHKKLISFLSKNVNRYNKFDKYQPAGYNVTFDMQFLAEFFKKCNDKYFGSWIDYHKLDVATLVMFFKLKGLLKLEKYRLTYVAEALNIPLMAHDAKEDIMATREIFYKLLNKVEIKGDLNV